MAKNHTVHHLLTLYALGASTTAIKSQYNDHKKSQRSLGTLNDDIVQRMHDPQQFQTYLGKEEHYHNFLEFWRQEIYLDGYEAVVLRYLFSGTDQANDLLTRCFAGRFALPSILVQCDAYTASEGFLHPLIHLGFALEYKQPAIIAEALAQAALHKAYLAPFFLDAEKRADQSPEALANTKSLHTLLDDIRANKKLMDAAHWEDDNKIRDGVLVRAPQEIVDIASQWSVLPEDLDFRNAEMVNTVGERVSSYRQIIHFG
jgi:Questin oxidase-like